MIGKNMVFIARSLDGYIADRKGGLDWLDLVPNPEHRDRGRTVQNFLKEDLIEELIITNIPILLGGGIPLFGDLPDAMEFELVESVIYLDALVQDRYRRKRQDRLNPDSCNSINF
jgi:hypothetical protein